MNSLNHQALNPEPFTRHLAPDLKTKFLSLDTQGDFAQAADLLQKQALIHEAIHYAKARKLFEKAIDLAVANGQSAMAENILREAGRWQRLADLLVSQERFAEAAEIFEKQHDYAKAAKAYFRAQAYEKAAILYARIKQYMNAVMSYQKLGLLDKQLEMQVAAFENDMLLTDGDLAASNVSRIMAIHAAKIYIKREDKLEEGLALLEKAQALESTAASLVENEDFSLAAKLYERASDFTRAMTNYEMAQEIDKAIEMAQKLGLDSVEIDLLKRHKAFFALGRKYILLKQNDNALAALKQIDRNDTNYHNALELQGDIYYTSKKFQDAIDCYETLQLDNLLPDKLKKVAYKAACCYESIQNYDKAQQQYQIVYSLDPSFRDTADKLRYLASKIQSLDTSHDDEHPSSRNQRVSNQRHATPSIMLGDVEIPSLGNDRYNVVEEIAHGGMGVVYKAIDNILMRTVALKVLSSKLKDNKVALEYFMREARASAQLQHVNIVTIYDIGSFVDGTVYLAMEYVDGKTLKQIITQTGPFPTKFLVQLTMHACKGLQYAHNNGIIHRDIKSSNMMLAKKDKTLKILDLGLAKVLNEHEKGSTQAIGTPYYMSPEQVLGNEIDCRSDIYSLGITLYELATGSLPFSRGDLPYKHVHEAPPAPSSINPKINPQLEQIILKMLKKKVDERYSSCDEIISVLKRLDYNES